MLRVVIAEDEALCRERLRKFLEAEPSVQIVAECATGDEALRAIREMNPGIVFLDVRMPGLDGFGVVEGLGTTPPVIIFVTAHDKFALRAFNVPAADFLLKPFNRERFQMALQRGRERVRHTSPNNWSPPDLAFGPDTGGKLERLTIKSEGRILILKTADIEWVSSADNYVELHVGGVSHLLHTTITALSRKLPQSRFIQINRSSMVNLDRIKEIRPRTHGDYFVVLLDGTRLNGSRNFRQGCVNGVFRSALESRNSHA